MSKKYQVYGIGNAIVDSQVQVEEEVLESLKLPKAGMTLVEEEQQRDLMGHFAGRDFNQASGGSAANTIISLAGLGVNTAYSCVIGDDEPGKFYLEEMASLNIALHTDPRKGKKTGSCFILITPDAERTMATYLGATAEFSGEDINVEYMAESEWLYIEGYLLSTEPGQAAVREAIKLAQEHKTKIAFTFSDVFIVECFRDALDQVVKSSDLIFANFSESKAYTAKESLEDTFNQMKVSCPGVVMTMGSEGVKYSLSGEEGFVAACKVTALDDTGAGDMFAGGFLYGLTNGLSAKESAELAGFLASRVVSQLGPRLDTDIAQLARDNGYL